VPRKPRYTPPGSVQHIVSRIAASEFRIRGDAERRELGRRFGVSIMQTDWAALAYDWMSNHEHVATLAGQDEADTFLKPWHAGFATWLNKSQGRFGSVYAGRPSNITFEREETIAILIAYIHNNPVRAGLVKDPVESTWSSHRAYVGEDRPPPWLQVERGLTLCGFSSTGNGRANFHDFVRSRAGLPRDPTMVGHDIPPVQNAVREHVGPSVEVVPAIALEPAPIAMLRIGGFLRRTSDVPPEQLLAAVALKRGIPVSAVQSRRRTADVVHVRRLVAFIWIRLWNRRAAELAPILGVTAQACGYLLKLTLGVEATLLRDAETIDSTLARTTVR
jgi:hypothetical protein